MSERSPRELHGVYLYDGTRSADFNMKDLGTYVRRTLNIVGVKVRGDIAGRWPRRVGSLSRRYARAKILDPRTPCTDRTPLPGEIHFEEKRLKNPGSEIYGIVYDGLLVQEALREFIPRRETGLRHIHIILTNQLLATWDEADLRYHIRAAIFGVPSVLSTTGLVEGPARPRDYYLLKHSIGPVRWDAAAQEDAARGLKDKMVDHRDPRLPEILKGYVMQSVVYHLIGDPFCPDARCRLFNAHWQEEMIRAQLTGRDEFCPRHEKLMEEVRRGGYDAN